MADLDDFFAKKDKKKGKAKKFVTAEEIAKQLDDTSKKVVESKMKLRPVDLTDGRHETHDMDDEWKVVEETKKDYSGLKLAQLTIDDEGNQLDSENAGDINDPNNDAEGREGEDRDPTKPWNKVDANAAAKEKVVAAEPAPTTSNIYISPAMKSLMAKQKQKKGIAPDLQSEEYFPTLGQEKPAEPPKQPKPDPTFEEVKHGMRAKTVEQSSTSQISIGNRYNTLNNDAS
ncbi:protein CDV3 homolog [Anopheles maculipalpis]|uniref:protein CDV3 homolog n=1 Tax=Anopheles maculipalpis TaxID=1496333 RepID=UPI002159A9D5|nr:protein CDV3 homolog [Anopheles maculipalpis]